MPSCRIERPCLRCPEKRARRQGHEWRTVGSNFGVPAGKLHGGSPGSPMPTLLCFTVTRNAHPAILILSRESAPCARSPLLLLPCVTRVTVTKPPDANGRWDSPRTCEGCSWGWTNESAHGKWTVCGLSQSLPNGAQALAWATSPASSGALAAVGWRWRGAGLAAARAGVEAPSG